MLSARQWVLSVPKCLRWFARSGLIDDDHVRALLKVKDSGGFAPLICVIHFETGGLGWSFGDREDGLGSKRG